jgi:NitT/TauT family transport system ATP-binding protein
MPRMALAGWQSGSDDPTAIADAIFLAREGPLRIGVPFLYSMHRLLLNYWLRNHPRYDEGAVEIITTPPPRRADALQDGALNVFCVGEPWGSVAVQRGVGTILMSSAAIWRFTPEKVLAVRHDLTQSDPETCHALIRAVYSASRWLDRPDNKPLAVDILSRSQHLDLPEHVVDPAIIGRLVMQKGQMATDTSRFMLFHDHAATFPWRSQTGWIGAQLAGLHGLDVPASIKRAKRPFRSDFYRRALGDTGAYMPGASEKLEGAMAHETAVASSRGTRILAPDACFDGAVFDSSTEPPLNS